MRDPDSGWINASIYRVQLHDRATVTIQFDHAGRHGAIIARKYWAAGKPCPVAIVSGPDPALFVAGFEYLPEGASEYDFAGAIKGRPIEVADAPLTGLPVPARAEIVFEGHLRAADDTLPEGPFGEFTGYYAAEKRPAPTLRVEAAHWRNDPILLGSPPMKPPRFHFGLPLRAASIWDNLDSAGVTDVVGAWQHVAQLMTVVALRPRYAGHAKRAALIAAAQSYMARLVVAVDEDVDPSDLADVMWAIATRCEPAEQVDIVRNAWSSALDPRLSPEARARGETSHSKMILDATKPFGWRDQFPPPLRPHARRGARDRGEVVGEAEAVAVARPSTTGFALRKDEGTCTALLILSGAQRSRRTHVANHASHSAAWRFEGWGVRVRKWGRISSAMAAWFASTMLCGMVPNCVLVSE